MKTELQKVAELQGLSYDKKVKVAWGTYRGYKIAIKEDTYLRQYSFYFPIKKLETNAFSSQDEIVQILLADKKLIKNAAYKEFNLKLDVPMIGMAKGNRNNIITVLDMVVGLASAHTYETCCEVCGGDANNSFYSINEIPFYACEECYEKTVSDLSNVKAAIKQKKGNYLTGLLGGFLGSLIGVALIVAVAATGHIHSLTGIVLALCIIKGYQLFGGKLNILGIILNGLIAIIMVYVANYITSGYQIYHSYNIEIIDAVKLVKHYIKTYSEFSSIFYENLVKMYLYTLISAAAVFFYAYETNNGKYSTKKLGA